MQTIFMTCYGNEGNSKYLCVRGFKEFSYLDLIIRMAKAKGLISRWVIDKF